MGDAAEKDNQAEDIDLTPHEIERAFKGSFKNFVIPGTLKTDIGSYFDRTKPHIKALIGKQPEEMESAKVIMTLWARQKKAKESFIKLDPKDAETSSTSTLRGYQQYNTNKEFNCFMVIVMIPSNTL